MQLQDRYDWVVLGDHPGALLSGCLASHLGLSVLFLPLTPSVLRMQSSRGQIIDPEPNAILGLGKVGKKEGLLGACLSQLGNGPMLGHSQFIRGGDELAPQILTSQVRLTLGADDSTIQLEQEREWGKDLTQQAGLTSALKIAEASVLNFWAEWPLQSLNTLYPSKKPNWFERFLRARAQISPKLPSHWIQKEKTERRAKGIVRNWLESGDSLESLKRKMPLFKKSEIVSEKTWSDWNEFLQGAWVYLSQSPSAKPAVKDRLHHLALARTLASFRGGLSQYRRFLVALAEKSGAQAPKEVECRRVFVEDGKLMGIQVSDRGKTIGARGLILGGALDHFKEVLSFSGRRASSLPVEASKPDAWRFTLALTVRSEAIPMGLRPRSIWYEKGAPPIEIEFAEPEEYDLPQKDHRLIFARTWLPFEAETLKVSYQRTIAARLFRKLSEVFPFLEYHVVQAYPDFREPETASKDEFSEVYGFVSPEFIPDNLRIYGGEGVGARTPIRGLYIANNESYPRLGSFGGTAAAIEAVTHYSGLAGQATQDRLREFWA
jgi:hypothetical protein